MVEEHFHLNHFQLNKLLHSKTNKLYFFHFLFNLAKAMIAIFVPVYLYKNGFSIKLILLIYILQSFFFLLFMPLSAKIINKIGFKKSILFSIPFYFAGLLTINNLSNSNILLALLFSFFIGFYCALFWPAYHCEIAEGEKKQKRNDEIGNLQIILTLVTSLGPYLGSLFLSILDYTSLLIAGLVITICGIIPLLLASDLKIDDVKISYKDYIKFLNKKKYKNSKIAYLSQGIETNSLSMIIWPLITFIFFNQNYVKYGTLYTFISLISIVFMFFLKKHLNKYKQKNNYFLKNSSITLSTAWFLKLFLFSMGNFFLYFIMSFAKIARNTMQITFMTIFYNNAKQIGVIKHIAFREFFVHISRIFFFSFIILVMFIFGENKQTLMFSIIFGVISAYSLSFLKEEVLL